MAARVSIGERRPIAVLPREVRERIAAGEVIEGPAAVVKELLENALDAGARSVDVDVRGGGLALIRVADDGEGIPRDQVELAFQQHATSKIRAVGDLQQVRTLGFRGEALHSIAAVADVTLVTAAGEDGRGTSITVAGGRIIRRAGASRPRGTTVVVQGLFQAIPARLAFVRDEQRELNRIGALLRRYALVYPEVRLSLAVDGRRTFRVSGAGRMETALLEVFGPRLSAKLAEVEPVEVGAARITGFVGGRTATRANRRGLLLAVNGRPASCPALLEAMEEGYRPLLPRGRHPLAILRLAADPATVDANVHPAKAEVRLRDEALVAGALRELVQRHLAAAVAPEEPDREFALGPLQYRLRTAPGWLKDDPLSWLRGARRRPAVLDRKALAELVVLGQLQGAVIVAEGAAGLYLVDQHRAHERIIYESLRRQHDAEELSGQYLLEPLLLELSQPQAARFAEHLPALAGWGFHCEHFGGRSFLVRAVPLLPGGDEIAGALVDAVREAAAEDGDLIDRALTGVACRSAVRRGTKLDEVEMRKLLVQLAETAMPAVCPHGSPAVLHLSRGFLKKHFEWG